MKGSVGSTHAASHERSLKQKKRLSWRDNLESESDNSMSPEKQKNRDSVSSVISNAIERASRTSTPPLNAQTQSRTTPPKADITEHPLNLSAGMDLFDSPGNGLPCGGPGGIDIFGNVIEAMSDKDISGAARLDFGSEPEPLKKVIVKEQAKTKRPDEDLDQAIRSADAAEGERSSGRISQTSEEALLSESDRDQSSSDSGSGSGSGSGNGGNAASAFNDLVKKDRETKMALAVQQASVSPKPIESPESQGSGGSPPVREERRLSSGSAGSNGSGGSSDGKNYRLQVGGSSSSTAGLSGER